MSEQHPHVPRQLTPEEVSSISAIKRVFRKFPRSLQIFDHSGTLLIIDPKSQQVFATITGALSDGGDPGTIWIDEVEYLAGLNEW